MSSHYFACWSAPEVVLLSWSFHLLLDPGYRVPVYASLSNSHLACEYKCTTRYINSTKGTWSYHGVYVYLPKPSKHVGPNTHPIQIGLEALARNGSDDSSTPTCFQTGSIWPKPDSQPERNWIQASFAQYELGTSVEKNATKSQSGKLTLVAGQLHSARTKPNDSYTLSCFWTS